MNEVEKTIKNVTTTEKVLQNGVVTVPKHIRKYLDIEIGDLVTYQILSVKKMRKQGKKNGE
jgi:bifunctional DNA-binding transcriptional regulator/antitoxin component of YhaV-PrlF toxin-antitoxin module